MMKHIRDPDEVQEHASVEDALRVVAADTHALGSTAEVATSSTRKLPKARQVRKCSPHEVHGFARRGRLLGCARDPSSQPWMIECSGQFASAYRNAFP